MTDSQYRKLRAEWAALLKADGFHDIESPGGAIAQSSESLSHGVTTSRLNALAEQEAGKALVERNEFSTPFERKVWELHLEGVSARGIAKRLCVYRKLVDETIHCMRERLQRPRRGRPRDPGSLRSHGLRMALLLTPDAALALDHLAESLGSSKSDAIRCAIVWAAKNMLVKSIVSKSK